MGVARAPEPTVIAPGNHDGVHLGHQALVRTARAHADRIGAKSLAITFDPHPAALLAPERVPEPLTSTSRRLELLRHAGANDALALTFDPAFSRLLPEAFVVEVLLQKFGARGVVCGPDFRFGADRVGDVDMLRGFGERFGFFVDVVAPVQIEGATVSSTRIRQLLREGDAASAARCLGHVHEIAGRVIQGDQRGRTIGFPTANLALEGTLIPKDGVYATVTRLEGQWVVGAMNIGTRPTFGAGRSVEVHFLDFQGDLYGRALRVGIVDRLRDEQRFSGVDALRAQLEADVGRARACVSEANERFFSWL